MDFNNPYNRQVFLKFLYNFLPDFIRHEEEIDINQKCKFLKTAYKIGSSKKLDLKIYEIEHNSENDPRISLSKETFTFLKDYYANKALVVFHNTKSKNYRFSLITLNTKWEEDKKVKITPSNPKRYSFFLGPTAKINTPKQFLINKGKVVSFQDLIERFSVEIVTKQFFDEFRQIFDQAKNEFIKSNKSTINWLKDNTSNQEEYEDEVNKFIFTFLGRIIFIYFLQRKDWIEDDKLFIKHYLENNPIVNLYPDFFTPLFFEVFSKREADRPKQIRQQYQNTPYLNGGLFEQSHLEKENPYINFSNLFIKKLILNFFEVYNFTIDENTPFDQEVSIDPEMLGKVFENTLAEEERGAKGTFYTPKEIVHYMVLESLSQFLINETNIKSQLIKNFVYQHKLKGLKVVNIRLLDNKLKNIKVLDPAVGSAAFPVEMMQILVTLRKLLNVEVGKNINEVELKKRFIKHNLFGVDIDPGAIEIAKLRLWLALIVDYKKSDAQPLPNLDFQFRIGNSLLEKVAGFEIVTDDYLATKNKIYPQPEQTELIPSNKSTQTSLNLSENKTSIELQEMQQIIDKFFDAENEDQKKQLKQSFDKLENKIFTSRINELKNQAESILNNANGNKNKLKVFQKKLDGITHLKNTFKWGTHKLFIPKLHFAEVYRENNGFDIVIGNPPYGVKIDQEIKDWHNLGSKDSYGVFISTSLKRFLKPNGVLAFIVSDTWLTIKSHFQLRQQVLNKQLHQVIRLHQDCFDATVNPCVCLISNNEQKGNNLIVADFTNISTRKEIDVLREKLFNLDHYIGTSTPDFAIYSYPQDLIKTNSNFPIFVANPKIFQLMNDTLPPIKTENGQNIRKINFNQKTVELIKLGEIAEVKQGLATGDNKHYLFQNPEARGTYKNINHFKQYLLSESDLEKISNNNDLRKKVVEKGFHQSKKEADFDQDLWFNGKYIVPYDKGGESDTGTGWLPNYHVPTNYFINWSQKSVNRMQTKTSEKQDGKIASRVQNKEYYFKQGLSWSDAGYYSPTIRFSGLGIFDVKGSRMIINHSINIKDVNALLTSKLLKFWIKNINNHTVSTQVDDFRELAIPLKINKRVSQIVIQIIKKQKTNQKYDYMSNEQKEIDKLVYKMYGLNQEDEKEVETWYARRYPKLAKYCDI